MLALKLLIDDLERLVNGDCVEGAPLWRFDEINDDGAELL